MILDIIGKIFGIGGDYLKGKQEIKLQSLQAVERLKIKSMDNASNWESISAAKSSRFLRWILAMHLLALIDASIWMSMTEHPDPAILFRTIEQMPKWCQGLLATIYGFAFGAAPLKSAGAKAFSLFINRKKK